MDSPSLERPFSGEVSTAAAALALGPEFVTAVGKVIASHVRNELTGASVFDEPAIALAPTPEDKWLACRIAMEEYGHHLKFNGLAADLGLEDAMAKQALSVFEYELTTWVEFVVLKAIVDLAEVVLMEELAASCTYLPLRTLAAKLLPEEHFHVAFGRSHAIAMVHHADTRAAVQQALDDLVPFTLPFFGRSASPNNDLFRRWGIKRSTNDECRAHFVERSRRFVVGDLGLVYPEVELSWAG